MVKGQMSYEIHDPRAYMTPDVVADFTTAELMERRSAYEGPGIYAQ
jgi:hypothetical protein